MDDIEIVVHKSPDECLKIIRSTFLSYDYQLELNRYTYKEKKNHLFFYLNRIGVPPITIISYLTKNGDKETELRFSFKENIAIILLFWVVCLFFFISSLVMLICFFFDYVNGDVTNSITDIILTILVPMMLLAYSILWPIYHNKFRRVDRENFIKKIKSALSVDE